MNDKKALRSELKKRRSEMSEAVKSGHDSLIAQRVTACDFYKTADALLIYVSSKIEVGTRGIIERALSEGKKVFTPRCIAGTNEMVFCRIRSFDDLESGSWGIYEPRQYCELYVGAENAVCITPALAYDRDGYRLGFGKGYYDRFLNGFKGRRLGICYDSFILESVFRDCFDVPVELIITENREIIIDDEREE